jgi:hypothetical protein
MALFVTVLAGVRDERATAEATVRRRGSLTAGDSSRKPR